MFSILLNCKRINLMYQVFIILLSTYCFAENIETIYKSRIDMLQSLDDKDIPNPRNHVIENMKDIVLFGPPILPNVYDTLKKKDPFLDSYLSYVMLSISKKVFLSSDGREDERTAYPKYQAQLWIDWWEKERFDIPEQFEERYTKWKQESLEFRVMRPTAVDYVSVYSKDKNKFLQWKNMPDGLEKKRLDPLTRTAYQQMLDLGIVALPFAIEKIREGEVDLIEAVNYWTDDALKKSAEEKGIPADQMRDYCLKWWDENKENWLLSPIEKQQQ